MCSVSTKYPLISLQAIFISGDKFILHTLALISTMHQRTAEDFGSHSQTVFLRSVSCWWRRKQIQK